MWALLWNLWVREAETRVVPEMGFLGSRSHHANLELTQASAEEIEELIRSLHNLQIWGVDIMHKVPHLD